MDMILYTLKPDELKAIIQDAVAEGIKTLPTAVPAKEDELITIAEVAKYFQVSKVTIFAWKKAGLLQSYRISNKVYFKKNEMIKSLREVKRN